MGESGRLALALSHRMHDIFHGTPPSELDEEQATLVRTSIRDDLYTWDYMGERSWGEIYRVILYMAILDGFPAHGEEVEHWIRRGELFEHITDFFWGDCEPALDLESLMPYLGADGNLICEGDTVIGTATTPWSRRPQRDASSALELRVYALTVVGAAGDPERAGWAWVLPTGDAGGGAWLRTSELALVLRW